MLVHQTDAIVFRDEFLEWCDKGYDYIGAPWFAGDTVSDDNALVGVGNGGLSLRRISSFTAVLEDGELSGDLTHLYRIPAHFGLRNLSLLKLLMHLSKRGLRLPYRRLFLLFFFTHRHPNEDLFWGAFARLFSPDFKTPSCEEALAFSIEVNPRRCYRMLKGNLPFGCHAWAKWDRQFWEEMLKREFNTLHHD